MKLKPDSALRSLCAAHLAMHAVPAAIPCLGSIHLVPKASLLDGAQTPLPSSLTPDRKGKLPRSVFGPKCAGVTKVTGLPGHRFWVPPAMETTGVLQPHDTAALQGRVTSPGQFYHQFVVLKK